MEEEAQIEWTRLLAVVTESEGSCRGPRADVGVGTSLHLLHLLAAAPSPHPTQPTGAPSCLSIAASEPQGSAQLPGRRRGLLLTHADTPGTRVGRAWAQAAGGDWHSVQRHQRPRWFRAKGETSQVHASACPWHKAPGLRCNRDHAESGAGAKRHGPLGYTRSKGGPGKAWQGRGLLG